MTSFEDAGRRMKPSTWGHRSVTAMIFHCRLVATQNDICTAFSWMELQPFSVFHPRYSQLSEAERYFLERRSVSPNRRQPMSFEDKRTLQHLDLKPAGMDTAAVMRDRDFWKQKSQSLEMQLRHITKWARDLQQDWRFWYFSFSNCPVSMEYVIDIVLNLQYIEITCQYMYVRIYKIAEQKWLCKSEIRPFLWKTQKIMKILWTLQYKSTDQKSVKISFVDLFLHKSL